MRQLNDFVRVTVPMKVTLGGQCSTKNTSEFACHKDELIYLTGEEITGRKKRKKRQREERGIENREQEQPGYEQSKE